MSLPGSGGGPNPRIPPRYRGLVMAAARASGLPVKIVATQIDYESAWDPTVTSSAGAEGIAQFEPSAWATYGHGSPYNPRDAFVAYAKYMGALLHQYKGNVRDSLAAYNAGPGNLAAGYPYADTILSGAGYTGNPTAGGGSGPEIYGNPMRGVKPITPERIDMGVDYAGSGPIYALGPGVITEAGHNWAGAVGAAYPGTWITEHITQGPLSGRDVYVAEDIFNVGVHTGQHVTAGTVLGQLRGGMETGFAAAGAEGTGGTTAAMAAGQSSTSGDPGAVSTAYGKGYSEILHKLGAPAGIEGTPSGTMPAWLSSAVTKIQGGNFSGGGAGGLLGLGGLGSIGSGLQSIGDAIDKIAHAIDWFLDPGHWVRLICGFSGGIAVMMGVWSLTHVGGDLPGAGPVTKPMALPIGIVLVGGGGVLLFVAFHSLPSVTSLSTMLGYFREQASQSASQASGSSGGGGSQGGLMAVNS